MTFLFLCRRMLVGGLGVLLVVWASSASAEIEVIETPGGLTVWLQREPAIPIVALNFAFRGGSTLEPDGREGLANMVTRLLDEGAGDLDSQAFQDRLDELSVRFAFDSGRDAFFGSMTTLTDNVDEAFDLLAMALNDPRFDEEPVERIREQISVRLAYSAEDPNRVAWRTWAKTAFPDHTYGRPDEGTLESIAAITADDMKAYVTDAFARDRLIISAVGDIDAERLAGLVDRVFAGLPANGAPLDTADIRPTTGQTVVVDMDVPQSAILLGLPGLKRDHPDYYVATVLNKVLGGGGLNTRLFEEVRRKRGLAYSASTSLTPFDHAGLLIGSVGTQNARAGETIDVVKDVFADIAANGITQTELNDARDYLTGSFPLRLDSNSEIARMLVAMQFNDLGPDYLEQRNGFIEAVTLDDVNRLAAELLKPDDLLIVVAGRPEGVVSTTAVE